MNAAAKVASVAASAYALLMIWGEPATKLHTIQIGLLGDGAFTLTTFSPVRPVKRVTSATMASLIAVTVEAGCTELVSSPRICAPLKCTEDTMIGPPMLILADLIHRPVKAPDTVIGFGCSNIIFFCL